MNSDNFKVNLSLRDAVLKLDGGLIRQSVGDGDAAQGMFLKLYFITRDIFRMDIR